MSIEFPASFTNPERMGVINATWINFPTPGGRQRSLLFPPLADFDHSLGFCLMLAGSIQDSTLGIQLIREADAPVIALCGASPQTASPLSPAAFDPFPVDCPLWRKALASGPQAVLDLWSSDAIASPVGAPLVLSSSGRGPMAIMASVVMRAAMAQLGARINLEDAELVLASLDVAAGLLKDDGMSPFWSADDRDLIGAAATVLPALRSAYEQVLLSSPTTFSEDRPCQPVPPAHRKM